MIFHSELTHHEPGILFRGGDDPGGFENDPGIAFGIEIAFFF